MTAVTRSSAKPWEKSGLGEEFLSLVRRESMTKFHKRGDRTPPWGVPLIMYLNRVVPLRVKMTFL